MEYEILSTDEFDGWISEETARSRVQIADRLNRIQDNGHFGDYKYLRKNIWELRWRSGRRIYYSVIPESQVLLILGGNKNGQSKDIKKAEKIYKEWVSDET